MRALLLSVKYLDDSTPRDGCAKIAIGAVASLFLLLGCVNTVVGMGPVVTRNITSQNDVVEAMMQFPSINNRAFDSWAEGMANANFQQFRERVILPRLFQLLEEGSSYFYLGNFQLAYNEQLSLIGVLFSSKWGNLGSLDQGSMVNTALFWLKEQREVQIIDIFIDPRELYQTIAAFARSSLVAQFPAEAIDRAIQPDRDHIRYLLLGNDYLSAFWPPGAFRPDEPAEVATRVDVPWSLILAGRELQDVVARAFLPARFNAMPVPGG